MTASCNPALYLIYTQTKSANIVFVLSFFYLGEANLTLKVRHLLLERHQQQINTHERH